MLQEEEEIKTVEGLEYNQGDIYRIVEKDADGFIATVRGLPLNILSMVINAKAWRCYRVLKGSGNFEKYTKNVAHIDPECVTNQVVEDVSKFDLSQNENWADLSVALRSRVLINKTKEKSAKLIIKADDPELFLFIDDKEKYLSEVFRRSKTRIIEVLDDERILRIGDDFSWSRMAEYVAVKNGVKEIPERAFFDSQYNKYIVIPPSVVRIASSAFVGCPNLQAITIPGAIIGRVDLKILVVLNNVLLGLRIANTKCHINGVPFEKYKEVDTFTITPTILHIQSDTFYGCNNLKSVVMPNSIDTIEAGTFTGCSSLKSVIIPASVKSVRWSAFCGCDSLESIQMPGEIVGRANRNIVLILNCALIGVSIDNSDCTINGVHFMDYKELVNYVVPDYVTRINDEAFFDCRSLESIVLPDSVTFIGDEAFTGCTYLESVVIPPHITRIGDGTFYGCASFVSIVVPPSVTSIGCGAFEGCVFLKSIVIPPSVTSIGDFALNDCRSLESIVTPGEIIGRVNLCLIVILDHYLMGVNVVNQECVINSIPFLEYKEVSDLVVPASVIGIRDNSFRTCNSLQSIAIPRSLRNIGSESLPMNCKIIWK